VAPEGAYQLCTALARGVLESAVNGHEAERRCRIVRTQHVVERLQVVERQNTPCSQHSRQLAVDQVLEGTLDHGVRPVSQAAENVASEVLVFGGDEIGKPPVEANGVNAGDYVLLKQLPEPMNHIVIEVLSTQRNLKRHFLFAPLTLSLPMQAQRVHDSFNLSLQLVCATDLTA
jgi:hypothetical protein